MKITSKAVDQFLEILSPIDRHFASLLERLEGKPNPELRLAAALASYCTTEHGDVCVPLEHAKAYFEKEQVPFDFPDPDDWTAKLRLSTNVGAPGDFRPLILDSRGRLYLHRYWTYESQLATAIRSRLTAAPFDAGRLKEGLARLFPDQHEALNLQKAAAALCVTRKFSVISGGPGTGKTTTVLKVLCLLAEQAFPRKLSFALAAPTGKAAARLEETIQLGKTKLNCPSQIKALLPESASTLHRLLGSQIGSPDFVHHAKHRLPLDVLVIDEASMVDLALMTKTFAALPASCRIILLGDKDQLASVEAGAVFGEICSGAANRFTQTFSDDYFSWTGEALPEPPPGSGVSDTVIELKHSFRFGAAIETLSQSVQQGDSETAFNLLSSDAGNISWRGIPRGPEFEQELRRLILENWLEYFAAATPNEALRLLDRFRILTPLRHGSLGVHRLNERIESILTKANLIEGRGAWYHRRPLIVARNDYDTKLFNGDVGIVEKSGRTGEFNVVFASKQGDQTQISPARIPQHDTAFAMTVHKIQGSEFEHVLLILPEMSSEILNRELIYTALTRARGRITVWAEKEVFQAALSQGGRRSSSLSELLTT